MWDALLYIAIMGVSTYLYTINYRVLTPPLKLISIAITVTFVATLCAIYVYRFKNEDNIYIYHILQIIQYIVYSLFFSQLVERVFVKRMIWLSIGLFTISALTLSSTVQPWDQYNSYETTLFNVLISLWSGYYLWRIFVDVKVEALEREASFWVVVGLLFTSLGNFFVQGLMAYLLANSESYALTVYWIHELMELVLFGIFLFALYIYLRYRPDSHRHY
jgi:hypothetical protein